MTESPAVDPAKYLTDSRRGDGWSIARQMAFLGALGGVAAAARAVGMNSQSAYRLRDRSPNFATLWGFAIEEGRGRAYDRAVDRGLNGYTAPVCRSGRLVGTVHRHDNRLLYAACYGEKMPRLRE